MGSERALARRITYEREKRGWKQVALAARMSALGCPLTQSAISKIENEDPPRRITVDELVAFSQVFEISAEELLLPPELVADHEALALLEEWRAARTAESQAQLKLVAHTREHPHTAAAIEDLLADDDRLWLDFSARRDAYGAVHEMAKHNAGRRSTDGKH